MTQHHTPMPALRVVEPGLWTTVQDLGRPGFGGLGVPSAGAFDRGAHLLANALVGNEADAATLEMTLVGGVFEALVPLTIALAGAPMQPTVVNVEGGTRTLRVPQCARLEPASRIMLHGAVAEARTYLAVRGGFHGVAVLGSRSSEAPLRAGDRLSASPSRGPFAWPDPTLVEPFGMTATEGGSSRESLTLRVVDGPEHHDADALHEEPFRIQTASNRMGVRLARVGAPFPLSFDPERLSAPVAPGTVQATPTGLIVLGVACGTMGGYPHVAQVITADLDRVGQLRPGQLVRFAPVDLATARMLDRAQRRARHDAALKLRARFSHPD